MIISIFIHISIIIIILWILKNRDKINLYLKRNIITREKILLEDSLKFIYECEYNSVECTLEVLCNKLLINKKYIEKVIDKLINLRLVIKRNNSLKLTVTGKQDALRIIRIHRLLEKYFAENTSIKDSDWHKLAEEQEHKLGIKEANEIAIKLGNPLIDPHGDPIPDETGLINVQESILLNDLQEGIFAEIIHIEDEPKELFSEIISKLLYPGMQLKIYKKFSDKILIEAEGKAIELSNKIAKNINVKEINDKYKLKNYTVPLSSLKIGETAEIVGISRMLRGQQRRRLLDLGIVPGTKIKAVLSSIGNDPIAYEIRGTLIALRRNQSSYIFIKK